MKLGDRVLVFPTPFQPHIAPTVGIVTRVHATGWVDVTIFPDMDTIRNLSFPTVKAIGPIIALDQSCELPANYRGGYFARPQRYGGPPMAQMVGAVIDPQIPGDGMSVNCDRATGSAAPKPKPKRFQN